MKGSSIFDTAIMAQEWMKRRLSEYLNLFLQQKGGRKVQGSAGTLSITL